jgi:GT2 family glycosyltransferase
MYNSTMKVAIIVLFLNNYEVTRECLESIMSLRYEDFAVISVNNGSSDDSQARLEAEFPLVTFIDTGSNLGYSGGNNVGIESALRLGADFIWVLNNDTIVDPEALGYLVDAANRNPEAAIFNPKIYYYSHPDKLIFGDYGWSKWKSIPKMTGHGERDYGQYDFPHEMQAADGASLFIRSRPIKDIGAFDEWYFCYFEDIDFSLRARRHGWRILFVPDARIWHRVSYTSIPGNPVTNYYGTRNSMRCALKNYPAYLPSIFVWGLSHHLVKCIVRRRYACLLMGIKGYIDFFMNRGGNKFA